MEKGVAWTATDVLSTMGCFFVAQFGNSWNSKFPKRIPATYPLHELIFGVKSIFGWPSCKHCTSYRMTNTSQSMEPPFTHENPRVLDVLDPNATYEIMSY